MYRLLVIITMVIIFFPGCTSGKKQSKGVEVVPDGAVIDSSDLFSDTYTITRVINKKNLEGRWKVTRMYRQKEQQPESLTNVSLSIADSAFAGKAPCNSIAGDFIIKGAAVKFTNIIATKMACPNLEQETAFLGLLEKKVKMIGLESSRLILRDRAGNMVFECVKDE